MFGMIRIEWHVAAVVLLPLLLDSCVSDPGPALKVWVVAEHFYDQNGRWPQNKSELFGGYDSKVDLQLYKNMTFCSKEDGSLDIYWTQGGGPFSRVGVGISKPTTPPASRPAPTQP